MRFCRFFSLAALGFFIAGCSPTGSATMDEEKEPYYLHGRELMKQRDFGGALRAFQKGLEVNPRSSLAHLEMGLLYEQHQKNPAAAIYHFNRFIEIKPDSPRAETVRDHLTGCKIELAKEITNTAGFQPGQAEKELKREVERLMAENQHLKLMLQNGGSGSGLITTPTNPPAVGTKSGKSTPSTPTASDRTHKILAGETPTSIAKKYGVKVETLIAANPGLDPTRLKVSQTINIPSRAP
ncbi:MAG: hypothetical protein JW388_0857 [Nitrospira sp.]|nr:hypothetical protein [Nitrospira sp.]